MRTPLLLLPLLAPLAAAASTDLRSIVREHRLANGMVWLIVERPQAPVFTAYLRVRVGGVDEQPGATGLAHVFEHMAFKGTPIVGTSDFEAERRLLDQIAEVGDALAVLRREGQAGSDEAKVLAAKLERLQARHDEITDENAFEQLYLGQGAVGLNATTNKDLTSYFVSFPENRLELWALAEAQRFASPVLRDFYKELEVVQEERRMRTESSPDGLMFEELSQLAFTVSPYRWPTVGYPEDLASLTVSGASAFQRRYYVPGNAVGAIVGDVRVAEVIPLLERTFGAIPAAPRPEEPVFAEPALRGVRRSAVYFDAEPALALAWRKPSLPSREDYVFDLLDIILGTGRSSRLHRALVETRIAQGVGAFTTPGSRESNLFVVSLRPMPGVSLQTAEARVLAELEKVARLGVTDRELQKAKNRIHATHARTLDSNAGLASTLSYFQAIAGDWRYAADHPAVIDSITAEEVQRVAKTFLDPQRRVVVELRRAPEARP